MKKILLTILLIFLIASSCFGQTLPKAKNISEFWPEGVKKIYTYTIDTTEIGQLKVQHIGVEDGLHRFSEEAQLNFFKVGLLNMRSTYNTLFLTPQGHFEYAEMEVFVDTTQESIKSRYQPEEKRIRSVINDKANRNYHAYVDGPVYPCDDNMFDHIEIILAMHDLTPGDSFTVPVFSTKGKYSTNLELKVRDKTAVRYGNYADSVWQVDIVAPVQLSAFVDKMHRMVRLEYPDRGLVVELQRDIFEQTETLYEDEGFFTNHIKRIPLYGFYLIVTFVWLLILGRESIKLKWSYILFLIGGASYFLIYITQVPLMKSFAAAYILPALQNQESIVLPSLVTALITGFIQQIVKVIPLVLLVNYIKVKRYIIISFAAFVGAGFGFIEAAYIHGPLFQADFFNTSMAIEKIFTILLHTSLGALMGYGLVKRRIIIYFVYASLIQFLSSYLFVFVHAQFLSLTVMQLFQTVIALALLVYMIMSQKKFKLGHVTGKKG